MIFLLADPDRPRAGQPEGGGPRGAGAGQGLRCAWRPRGVGRYESLWSRLQKFAWLNRLTVPQALEVLSPDVPGAQPAPAEFPALPDLGRRAQSWEPLAWALSRAVGQSRPEPTRESLLRGYLLPPPCSGTPARNAVLTAASVGANYLRFCPLCIGRGYHSPIHQLLFVRRCPAHDVALEECCPRCRVPVALGGHPCAPPYGCRCGRGFWPAIGEPIWPAGCGGEGPFGAVALWLRATAGEGGFAARTLLLEPRASNPAGSRPADERRWRRLRLELVPLFWQEAALREGMTLPPIPECLAPDPSRHGGVRRGQGGGWAAGGGVASSRPLTIPSGVWRQVSSSPFCHLDEGVYREVRCRLWHTTLGPRRATVRHWASGRTGLRSETESCDSETRVLAAAFARWRMYWEGLTDRRYLFDRGVGRGHGRVLDPAYRALEDAVWRCRLAWLFDVRALEALDGQPETVARRVLWEVYSSTYRECVVLAASGGRDVVAPAAATLSGESVPAFILPASRPGSLLTLWSSRWER